MRTVTVLACWLAPGVAPWCCSVRTQPHMRRGGRAGVGLGGSEDTGLCTELTAEAPGEMGLSGPGRMSRAWGGDSRAPPCQAGAGVLTGGLPSPLAAAQAGRTGRARFTFQNIHEALTSDGICDRAGLIAPASPSSSLSRSAPFVHTRLLSRPSSGSSPCPRIADLSPSSCLRVRMSCLSELGRRWRWGRPAWALCCLFCFRSLDFSTLYS